MIHEITKEQFEALNDALFIYGRVQFNKLLEDMTGITAAPCTIFEYYDSSGDYIGDSADCTVKGILKGAYITIKE